MIPPIQPLPRSGNFLVDMMDDFLDSQEEEESEQRIYLEPFVKQFNLQGER